MATMVDVALPLPAGPSTQHRPISQTRRSIEVIDVDLYDDELQERPAQRRRILSPEYISSDDEETGPTVPSMRPSPRSRRRMNRLISPPPPPWASHDVPPVPRLPTALDSLTSIRRRQSNGAAASGSGVIRANSQPFEFELGRDQDFWGQNDAVAGPSRLRSPPLPPAAHFRNPPAIRLGGGLITSAAGHARRERATREEVQRIRLQQGREAMMNVSRIVRQQENRRDGVGRMLAMIFGTYQGEQDNWGQARDWDINIHQVRNEPEYKAEYTHPNPAPSSYTYDFTAELESDPKTQVLVIDEESDTVVEPKAQSISFVCAYCMHALENDPDDVHSRAHIWALRCGHMICSSCMNINSIPPPIEAVVGPKTKGNGKGKGSSRARLPGQADSQPYNSSPIKSRLRSGRTTTINYEGPPASTATSWIPDIPKLLGRKRKPAAPKVEAIHQWSCQIPECGRLHTSIYMNGVWGPEREKGEGAIQVFL